MEKILSMKFEKERLVKEKHFELVENVKWLSKESDDYGFDISSFFGNLILSKHNTHATMMIEVKSITSDLIESFRFVLTRNEWDIAVNDIKKYYFYLWKNIKMLSKGSHAEGPLIVSAKKIIPYVPRDQHDRGKWQKCRIILNLKEISDDIIDPNKLICQVLSPKSN